MNPSEEYRNHQELFQRALRKARGWHGMKLQSKSDSGFMKFLYVVSLMFLWNRNFLTRYYTTIGKTIYLPKPVERFGEESSDYVLLVHEIQHKVDAKRFGALLWSFLYLFPQSLAPFALLAIWWPPALIFLLALAPWPAPFRVWAEVRGYAESYRAYQKVEPGLVPWDVWMGFLRGTFCGWGYYRMAWRWKPVEEALARSAGRTDQR